jgi:hypothetical protein
MDKITKRYPDNKISIPFPNVEALDEVKSFPADYCEFIEEYGDGIIENFLRIFNYYHVDYFTRRWRNKSKKHFTGARYIAKFYFKRKDKFASDAILIGDTVTGDQIIFWNGDFYVYIFQGTGWFGKVGEKLQDVLNFYRDGKIWYDVDLSFFTPMDMSLALESKEYLYV